MNLHTLALVLAALLMPAATHAAALDPAVEGLPDGWSSDTLYQGELGVYPGVMAELPDGRILIYDRATARLSVLAGDGSVGDYADLAELGTVTAMAYQPLIAQSSQDF